uniref:Uncharacterized protein n=2 Tax=Oryza sativa subsp. japonica TaxID=39947 RepID=Q33AL5_ORYSJ|nr:Hypothetical protein [Oryza sativa Japonica Group]ABB46910.1 hypothetical protein LOC_Os10g09340 [Oryza sativa Japonica Group]
MAGNLRKREEMYRQPQKRRHTGGGGGSQRRGLLRDCVSGALRDHAGQQRSSSSQSKNKAAFAARALCAPHEDVLARHFGGGVVSDFVKTAQEHIDSLDEHDNFKVAVHGAAHY